jgi:hypothetical protein
MTRIVFFWVGPDVTVPSYLVKSLALFPDSDREIVQLTDQETPAIEGVTRVVRNRLSKNIMVARLESYAAVSIDERFSFFCDADLLFLDRLQLTAAPARDILIMRRPNNMLVKSHFPEHYPEFDGRTFLEVMPFLFGGIAVRNAAGFFPELLQICMRLPERFHRWYGDQVSLFEAYKLNPTAFGFLDSRVYQFPMKGVASPAELLSLRGSGVQVIHFKGSQYKTLMEPTYRNLAEAVRARAERRD